MADLRSRPLPFRRYPDPATSSDPVISALVNRLAAIPPPKPDPEFRAELRAQLVAVTPRLVAEGVTAEDSAETRRGTDRALAALRAAWRRVPLRRPLVAVGILLAVFALLLTGALLLSRTTLPGDSLYGLKRASENVQLSLTSGDGARGKEYLTLAKRRVDEAAKLLARSGASGPAAAGSINAHTAGLITGTLTDGDSDLRNASRLLTGRAARTSSADPLQTLLKWSPGQASRLTAIANRIPAGALHNRAVSSKLLTDRVLERANRLHADLGCNCLIQTSSDDLGPLPCTSPCRPAPPGTIAPTPNRPNAPTGGSRRPSAPPASRPLHSQTPSR
jgi:Domain of unknown function (DUF5667)